MKRKSILAALLLLLAGLQTTWAQGFRVYKSDGTVAQFSMRTDSIVFYDGIGTDVDFGPFTPVNQCIVGTWYKSHSESVTFREDGTTDYISGGTYQFLPYQGEVLVYNSAKKLKQILRIHNVTAEELVVSTLGGTSFSVWSTTQPPQLVTSITLSETSLCLQPNNAKLLSAIVLPEDADNKEVAWKSSDEAVATLPAPGLVLAVGYGTCVITCSATDGSGVKAECQVTVKKPDTMEYVDLGLPSGTLWATCNVGASEPEEYGDYFAWGETKPKSMYNWSTYKWCNGSSTTMTKYCTRSDYGYNGFTDNLTELEPADDAATANWGSGWKMPSRDQIQELYNSSYTTSEWTHVNGVYGLKVTSKSNGNSIFLPAAGDRYGTSFGYARSYGYYWSRSLLTSYCYSAYYLYFSSGKRSWDYRNRDYGQSVRAVRVQE